ncbi:hypothetical protein A0H81_08035 [Grifola frondosa]|uniref:Uncharacterized protein n=1 Tax=Grifola frondosa TaxID=5627 RepID=A0A1C7M5F8_GRIFR|nr:hypothetical protein A0H81_08035 [Grifola frondosa]
MFHSAIDTPIPRQLHTSGPLPISGLPVNRCAGNSSLSFAGSARRIDASVLANFLPSGIAGETHAGLLQTYSQPITKNGLPRSYTLIGPVLMRPRLMSGAEQDGQAMPLNTSGCGSQ